MVSFNLALVRRLAVFVPLVAIVAGQSCSKPNATALPSLLYATTEELAYGLEAGRFTSVDLVEV